jgi:hypothetical protein
MATTPTSQGTDAPLSSRVHKAAIQIWFARVAQTDLTTRGMAWELHGTTAPLRTAVPTMAVLTPPGMHPK